MDLQRDFVRTTIGGGIKGLLSEVPYIGGFVMGAWDGYHESRSQDFINELSAKLNKLDETKVDNDYIQSEEFHDIILCSRQPMGRVFVTSDTRDVAFVSE